MKYTIIALTAATVIVNAQVVFDNTTNTFQCLGSAADKNFCAGESLQTNIIIRCTGTSGQPGNCNDNLAGVPPVGVKSFAPCYQTSDTSGDAACSYNGTVYPDDGSAPFPVPGSGSSSTTAPPATSTSSACLHCSTFSSNLCPNSGVTVTQICAPCGVTIETAVPCPASSPVSPTTTSGYGGPTTSTLSTSCTTCKTFATPICPGGGASVVCGPCGQPINSVVPCTLNSQLPTSTSSVVYVSVTEVSSTHSNPTQTGTYGNSTTSTTGLPQPTLANTAATMLYQGGLIAGVIGLIAALVM